jgi:hypothetical protein
MWGLVFGFIGLGAETSMQTDKIAAMQERWLVKFIIMLLSCFKTVSTLHWKEFSKSEDMSLLHECHNDIYFTSGMTVLAFSGFS